MTGTTSAVPKLVTLETNVPEDVAAALKQLARRSYRSAAMEIRVAIESHLKAAA